MPVLRPSPPSRPSRDKKFKRPFPSRKGSTAALGCRVRRPRRTPCGGPPSARCFERGRWKPHARARALPPIVHRKMILARRSSNGTIGNHLRSSPAMRDESAPSKHRPQNNEPIHIGCYKLKP